MTKEEQTQVCEWFETVFWPTYPGDLTRNRNGKRDNKGSKTYGMECILKVPNISSREEQKKIIGNLKAQIRYDRQDPDATRWPMVSSYVNRRRMYDEIESTAELKLSLERKLCKCGQETVGPKYSECGKCLESHAAKLEMMSILKEIGCATPGQSLQELSESCREYLRQNGGSKKLFNQMISSRQQPEHGNQ